MLMRKGKKPEFPNYFGPSIGRFPSDGAASMAVKGLNYPAVTDWVTHSI